MFLSDTILNHVAEVADEPDLTVTRYVLKERLGQGGMGSVYLVEDTQLHRDVALKVAGAGGLAERLTKEALAIARLEHPGIVPVHDAGTLPDGRAWYVMKQVRGERLDKWARSVDLRARVRMFLRVCEAVAFAHARGVIHRDLKPENVMVGEFGEALVMDWGLAGLRGSSSESLTAIASAVPGATLPGAVVGTPAYMAPEQARGDATDARSDVYGLGATLYALITGSHPVSGADALDVLAKVKKEGPPAVRAVAPQTPRPLAAICDKAMSRNPADRYESAGALAEDLGRFLEGRPVNARPESLFEQAVMLIHRHQGLFILGTGYLLLRLLILLFG